MWEFIGIGIIMSLIVIWRHNRQKRESERSNEFADRLSKIYFPELRDETPEINNKKEENK